MRKCILKILFASLDGDGLRRSDLVNWYLKEIESEIETEEELAQKKYLVDKVLNRLIDHVCDHYCNPFSFTILTKSLFFQVLS